MPPFDTHASELAITSPSSRFRPGSVRPSLQLKLCAALRIFLSGTGTCPSFYTVQCTLEVLLWRKFGVVRHTSGPVRTLTRVPMLAKNRMLSRCHRGADSGPSSPVRALAC